MKGKIGSGDADGREKGTDSLREGDRAYECWMGVGIKKRIGKTLRAERQRLVP